MSNRAIEQFECLGHSLDENRVFIIMTGNQIDLIMFSNPEIATLF